MRLDGAVGKKDELVRQQEAKLAELPSWHHLWQGRQALNE